VLTRLLFWLVVGAALALLGLVLLAPLLGAHSRLLGLFAGDATLRRTAVASALGLLVTASVFFRAPPGAPPRRKRPRPPGPPGA
jgi:hypothetical protein